MSRHRLPNVVPSPDVLRPAACRPREEGPAPRIQDLRLGPLLSGMLTLLACSGLCGLGCTPFRDFCLLGMDWARMALARAAKHLQVFTSRRNAYARQTGSCKPAISGPCIDIARCNPPPEDPFSKSGCMAPAGLHARASTPIRLSPPALFALPCRLPTPTPFREPACSWYRSPGRRTTVCPRPYPETAGTKRGSRPRGGTAFRY